MTDKLLHVYGVVEAGAPGLPGLQGRQGAPVRRIPHGSVAVLVSELDPLARLARGDLLAHAHVLEFIAERQSVLPMRFGVRAKSETELHAHVMDRPWRELLARFAGLVQFGVEGVHREEEALRELLRRDRTLVSMKERISAEREEVRSHALRLQLGERIAGALEGLRREDASLVLNLLNPCARAVAHRSAPGQVLSSSFLVERARRESFDIAVSRARAALPRLELRYLGPQPPWAFLDAAVTGGTWAC